MACTPAAWEASVSGGPRGLVWPGVWGLKGGDSCPVPRTCRFTKGKKKSQLFQGFVGLKLIFSEWGTLIHLNSVNWTICLNPGERPSMPVECWQNNLLGLFQNFYLKAFGFAAGRGVPQDSPQRFCDLLREWMLYRSHKCIERNCARNALWERETLTVIMWT